MHWKNHFTISTMKVGFNPMKLLFINLIQIIHRSVDYLLRPGFKMLKFDDNGP
jgi:hypothetical protein